MRHVASGQALITSILVLGFLTLGFSLVSMTAISEEFQTNEAFTNKAFANAAARGCMEQAMYRLGANSSYTGNETLSVGTASCTVRPITVSGGTYTLETWAQVGDQYTRYRVLLSNRIPITISSWDEIASF